MKSRRIIPSRENNSLWWQKLVIILSQGYDHQPKIERDPAAIERLVRWKHKAGFDVEHLFVNYSMFEGRGGEDTRTSYFKCFHGYCEVHAGRGRWYSPWPDVRSS